jgi:hypothetical protein
MQLKTSSWSAIDAGAMFQRTSKLSAAMVADDVLGRRDRAQERLFVRGAVEGAQADRGVDEDAPVIAAFDDGDEVRREARGRGSARLGYTRSASCAAGSKRGSRGDFGGGCGRGRRE